MITDFKIFYYYYCVQGEVKLLLDDTPLNQDIPHEYNISLTKKVVDNTYVFTEKDFPKYDKKKNDAEMAAIKQEQQQQQQRGKNGKATNNLLAKDRFVPYVKTIPSMRGFVICFFNSLLLYLVF